MAPAEDEKTMTSAEVEQQRGNQKAAPVNFELPTEFFDSCRLLPSPSHALSDRDVSKNDAVEESPVQEDITEHLNSLNDAKTMQRWSCNTCKAEFESLQDQRLHFKSDLHRFNLTEVAMQLETEKRKETEPTDKAGLCLIEEGDAVYQPSRNPWTKAGD